LCISLDDPRIPRRMVLRSSVDPTADDPADISLILG
jgi:hypothetical protein